MIVKKTAKLLLLSMLLCSAILAISLATVTTQRTETTTSNIQENFKANKQPSLVFIGDQIGGGGTPMSGNHT